MTLVSSPGEISYFPPGYKLIYIQVGRAGRCCPDVDSRLRGSQGSGGDTLAASWATAAADDITSHTGNPEEYLLRIYTDIVKSCQVK